MIKNQNILFSRIIDFQVLYRFFILNPAQNGDHTVLLNETVALEAYGYTYYSTAFDELSTNLQESGEYVDH